MSIRSISSLCASFRLIAYALVAVIAMEEMPRDVHSADHSLPETEYVDNTFIIKLKKAFNRGGASSSREDTARYVALPVVDQVPDASARSSREPAPKGWYGSSDSDEDDIRKQTPWYYKYSKAEKHMLDEFYRKRISLPSKPIEYAELSDEMDVGSLQFSQVTNALIKIAKDVGHVDDEFVKAFRARRKLIKDTRAEMDRLESQNDWQGPYAEIISNIQAKLDAAYPEMLEKWALGNLAYYFRGVLKVECSSKVKNQALFRLVTKKRGAKAASYFKRFWLDLKEKHPFPKDGREVQRVKGKDALRSRELT